MKEAGFVRRVTLENLPSFRPLLERPEGEGGEPERAGGRSPREARSPEVRAAETLFKGRPVRFQPPFDPPRSVHGRGRRPSLIAGGGPEIVSAALRGPLLWRKELVASDVQRQPGHPTGGLRLTKAGFKRSTGDLVDQKTYFRNDLFGAYDWKQVSESPMVEETQVLFEVFVLGRSLGRHRLSVSHKPTGEAGQGNYTTILKWGKLGKTIKEGNLTRRVLRLYGPATGCRGLFWIEII